MAYATSQEYRPRLGYETDRQRNRPVLAYQYSGDTALMPACWKPIADGTDYPFKYLRKETLENGGSAVLERGGSRLVFSESSSSSHSYDSDTWTALLVPGEPSHIEVSLGYSFQHPGSLDSWWFEFELSFGFVLAGGFIADYRIVCGNWGSAGAKPPDPVWDGGDSGLTTTEKWARGSAVAASFPVPYYATQVYIEFDSVQHNPDATSVSRTLDAAVQVWPGFINRLR